MINYRKLRASAAAFAACTILGQAASALPLPGIKAYAADEGYLLHDTFEDGDGDWSGRGQASASVSTKSAYKGSSALMVTDRSSAWNGAQKNLGTVLQAGKEYSFSACVQSVRSGADLMLSLQYKDAGGTTKYGHIAQAKADADSYMQLANTSFLVPEGAEDLVLYIETESGTSDLLIDEVIIAEAGTAIAEKAPGKAIVGDITGDGVINSFDVLMSRRGIVEGFEDKNAEKAADVDRNKEFNISDVVLLHEFVMGKITEFPYVEPEVPPESQGSSYSMEEFTDMIAKKVVNSEPYDSHKEKSGVKYGTIKKDKYYSTTCKRDKPYVILLPADYSEDKKYPVLYVMHGYYENENRMITDNGQMATRQIIGNAIAEGEAKDMIVVFPYIYSSATQATVSGMDEANNQAYDNFINDLTKDLMPYIEEHYSIKTGRENTALTGFSMGGRESLLIGMKRPDLFGYIGAICPAPGVTGSFKWDGDDCPYLVFLTAGSNDNVVYSTPNSYHENFTKNGVPHVWHYVEGGAHGDNSIQPHLYNFVRAVFQATN